MKIAIIGATGTAGRATTRTARQAGYDVITLSRATGIDLHTGEGLTSALDGADVAIDTSTPSRSAPTPTSSLLSATPRLALFGPASTPALTD